MFKKIKTILSYIFKPNCIIKGIKNPKRVINFLKKDLILEPEDYIFGLTEKNIQEIKKYIKEIKEKKDFEDYVWKRYNNFEKKLIKDKKSTGAGGTSREMGIILYTVIRLLKPEIVLETGVASGISSAYILFALSENKKGKLFSIDLPYEVDKKYPLNYIKKEGETFIPKEKKPGWLIPEELKKEWHLELGKSSEKLSLLLNKLKSVDIFIHDSEHSYENMIWEYKTVWPFLKEEGILFSHDVNWNSAFDEFCKEIKRQGIKYREEFGGIKK
jgi:hypothetical protein